MSDMRIMAKVNELGLNLELDSNTPGDGACFFWAVLQQLRRKEIYPLLRPELKELADTNDAATLRMRVCNFGLHSPVIQQNKKDLIYNTDGETWDEYWKNMKKVSKWASGAVLRTTAVFLQMNIKLVETVFSNKKAPFLTSYGTFDTAAASACVDLFIGLDHRFHFQSLLPVTGANPAPATAPTPLSIMTVAPSVSEDPAIFPAGKQQTISKAEEQSKKRKASEDNCADLLQADKDITLVCGGQTFKAHCVILSASSPVFRQMIR